MAEEIEVWRAGVTSQYVNREPSPEASISPRYPYNGSDAKSGGVTISAYLASKGRRYHACERITGDLQISTDGFNGYERAVATAFKNGASHGQVIKKYGAAPDKGPERKYSPGICIAAEREVISGNPDEAMISTSHVERMNLNMRMGMCRFTRLTNAFSKKYSNHCDALALYFFHYNFCRQHKSLRVSPSMAAGVTDELLSMEHLCWIMDAGTPPKKRGPYKKVAARAMP